MQGRAKPSMNRPVFGLLPVKKETGLANSDQTLGTPLPQECSSPLLKYDKEKTKPKS